MRLENIVWGARDPQKLGRFWVDALGAQIVTDEVDIIEARMTLAPDMFIDLCFPLMGDPEDVPQRLHLDLVGGTKQTEIVQRLIGLGAQPADIGQGDVPWVVLADAEGNAFCVMEDREVYRDGSGPIAALPLDSADPDRDLRFWSALTGWFPVGETALHSLRHPAGVGPLLELCPEPEPRRGKSTLHLDVRPDASDGDVLRLVRSLGGQVLEQPPGDLPWTICADPSGNEVCILGRA